MAERIVVLPETGLELTASEVAALHQMYQMPGAAVLDKVLISLRENHTDLAMTDGSENDWIMAKGACVLIKQLRNLPDSAEQLVNKLAE